MPQVSAAILRSAPSRIIAIASIRRAAEPSFSRPATIRSSAAVTSSRVIETAAPIDATPLRSQHRVRLSLIWESQNESTAGAVGITRARLRLADAVNRQHSQCVGSDTRDGAPTRAPALSLSFLLLALFAVNRV